MLPLTLQRFVAPFGLGTAFAVGDRPAFRHTAPPGAGNQPPGGRRPALVVGVTGHRPHRLDAAQRRWLERSSRQLLQRVCSASAIATPEPVQLQSALAEGADRTLARAAIEQGCALHAVLPFSRGEYASDFVSEASLKDYGELLARARHVRELPGDRRHPAHAYRLAGYAILDASDLLVAVWDGEPAAGPGGTGDVVAEAWRRRLPVLHLSTRGRVAPTLLLADSDHPPPLHAAGRVDRPLDDATLVGLVEAAVAAKRRPFP